MPITLDAPDGGDEPDVALANDEVRAARNAVAHWEAELAAKVADAQALDRWWMVALTQITGSREQRVEAAIAEVEAVRRKLEHARTVLEKAREQHAQAAQHRDAKLATEAERLAALEAVALRVQERGGPEAEELRRLDRAIDQLRARKEVTLAASAAASGVVAAANAVARRASSAKRHAMGDAMGVPFAGVQEWGDRAALRNEQREYARRARRLQEALKEVGAAFDGGSTLAEPSSLLHDLLLEQGGLIGDWMQAQRLASTQESFESVASDARALSDHLHQEHLQLKERLEAAEDQREALLQRLS